MRKLALHASALNDAEYDLYTQSLKEIVLGDCDEGDDSARAGQKGEGGASGDAYYERMTVGVREARAWLRGRYSSLSAGVIDGILRLFSPTLAIADTLSGEEFFAALRLVVHAEMGKEPERSLVFVQGAAPTRNVAAPMPSTSPGKPVPSPRKRPADLPPPPPLPLSRRPNAESMPASPTRPESFNPFSTSATATHSHSHPQPPLHPSQRPPSSSGSASAEITPSALKSHTAHNPFVSRPPSISTRSEDGNLPASRAGKIPPLPPRKPTQHPSVPVGSVSVAGDSASISGVTSVSASTSKPQPPPPPPPRHVSSRSRTERSLSPSKIQRQQPTFPPPLESTPSSSTTGGPPPKPPKPIQLAHAPSTGSTYTSPPSFPPKSSSGSVGSKLGTSPNVFKAPLSHATTSNLMTASTHNTLQASKVAHAVKKAEEHLEKERVMRVLKSSSSAAMVAGGRPRERRSQGPPLPKRRHEKQQVQQPSPPMSTSSLEQVVLAGSGDQERESEWERERERERERVKSDPPPLHPGRRGSYHRLVAQANAVLPSGPGGVVSPFEAVYGSGMNDEPEAFMTPSASSSNSTPFSHTGSESPTIQNHRVWRSKSLHHPSPPRPPLPTSTSSNASSSLTSNSTSTPGGVGGLVPPPRRKRPESVQVLPGSSSTSSGLGVNTSTLGAMFGNMGLKSYGGVGSRSPSSSRDASVAPTYGRVGTSHNRRSSLSATPTPTNTTTAQAFSVSNSNSTSNPSVNNPSGGVGSSTATTTTIQLSDSFHRTLASIQPRLDQARYKAEAGLNVCGVGRHNMNMGLNGRERRREDRESREGLMGSESEDEELEETRARLRETWEGKMSGDFDASMNVKRGRRRSGLGPSDGDDAFVDAPEGVMSSSGAGTGSMEASRGRGGPFDSRVGGPFDSRGGPRIGVMDGAGAGMDDGWRPL
ncbi:hypothetical protein BJ165DRAFT_1501565 [Panaeolus papilionaceus]|nr:hypothetical protein BJ165DRAFT_1501565 [Panaeolus papilionaceus]